MKYAFKEIKWGWGKMIIHKDFSIYTEGKRVSRVSGIYLNCAVCERKQMKCFRNYLNKFLKMSLWRWRGWGWDNIYKSTTSSTVDHTLWSDYPVLVSYTTWLIFNISELSSSISSNASNSSLIWLINDETFWISVC